MPKAAQAAPRTAQDQGLGAIIVTATKRETNLQRTPIAISVANTQALADRHAQSLLDLGDGSIVSAQKGHQQLQRRERDGEAERQDRSMSWIVQQAWKLARAEMKRIPSVNDVLPPAGVR